MTTSGNNVLPGRGPSRRILQVTAATVLTLLITVSDTSAQKATEQYIPIGASPGVSGKQSYIGRIVSADSASSTLAIETDSGRRHTLRVTETTRIWLDRSASSLPNTEGGFADCEAGRLVEAMHAGEDPETAVWIKVRVP